MTNTACLITFYIETLKRSFPTSPKKPSITQPVSFQK